MNDKDNACNDKTCLEWLRGLSAKSLDIMFGGNSLCDYIQDQDGAWCGDQLSCDRCVERWLLERKRSELKYE